MNLKEIIEATLIELDRGTEADTVAMYAPKFTVYANEACDEIVRRFKLTRVTGIVTIADPSGYASFDAYDMDRTPKRITRIMPAAFGTPPLDPDDDPPIIATEETLRRSFPFVQQIPSSGWVSIMDKRHVKPGDPVYVEYRYIPTPMDVNSLTPTGDPPSTPDEPDIPVMFHSLIPLYVRAREQCGQDPSLQGTSSAFFSLFNQKVYQLQRETLATPDSFQFKNYHFE